MAIQVAEPGSTSIPTGSRGVLQDSLHRRPVIADSKVDPGAVEIARPNGHERRDGTIKGSQGQLGPLRCDIGYDLYNENFPIRKRHHRRRRDGKLDVCGPHGYRRTARSYGSAISGRLRAEVRCRETTPPSRSSRMASHAPQRAPRVGADESSNGASMAERRRCSWTAARSVWASRWTSVQRLQRRPGGCAGANNHTTSRRLITTARDGVRIRIGDDAGLRRAQSSICSRQRTAPSSTSGQRASQFSGQRRGCDIDGDGRTTSSPRMKHEDHQRPRWNGTAASSTSFVQRRERPTSCRDSAVVTQTAFSTALPHNTPRRQRPSDVSDRPAETHGVVQDGRQRLPGQRQVTCARATTGGSGTNEGGVLRSGDQRPVLAARPRCATRPGDTRT